MVIFVRNANGMIWKKEEHIMLQKIKSLFVRRADLALGNFAMAFAGGSVQRFCFYIFHQPKMPEELMESDD